MLSSRPRLRHAVLLAAVVALFSGLVAVPIAAANTSVSGSLSYLEKVTLSPAAVVIVTIVDQTAAADAGAVIGQERIDAPAGVPIDFSVLVDADTIDPTHAYALFATIVDGTNTWENRHGEPVITGGPTNGIDLVLTARPATSPASITGTIVPPEGSELGSAAVAIAALIKVETGTLVARQVRPIVDPTDLSFTIGFEPAFIDPTATYVVKGGIIDGGAVWQNRAGVTAIAQGVAVGVVSLPITLVPTELPVASALPTAIPSGTASPSAAPSKSPGASGGPIKTANPTPTPTAAPTLTPTPTSTPSPTPSPSPSPSPTPTPTPAPTPTPTAPPSGAPTPSPVSGPVTGTLTYREPYKLSGDAFAVVALVRGTARASESSIVASEIDRDITSVPVTFKLDLGGATIDPSLTYTIQATIVDGANAWVTSRGIPVLTKGNPADVAITLGYRPDLLKGSVTGQITAVGLQPSANAYAMAVLVDPTTGESLGIDAKTADGGLPVAFAIPYTITDVDPTQDYVVTAEVGDQGVSWRNAAGVPVITKGNPKTAIQVVVTQVAAPAPSITPSPSPAPSPAPAPEPGKTGSGGLLAIIIIIAIVGAVAAFFIARRKNTTDTPTPDPETPDPAVTSPAGTSTATDADAPTAAPAPPSTDPAAIDPSTDTPPIDPPMLP